MTIAFIGKGGAGKTTLAASYIRHCQSNRHVLACDADHNVGLAAALGVPASPRHLSAHTPHIAAYLRGQRTDLGDRPMIGTTPPGVGSRRIHPTQADPFLQEYAYREPGLDLIVTGSYTSADAGHDCYHGKLDALLLVLSHVQLQVGVSVVMDAPAGTDLLGTALYYHCQALVVVVEPTPRSVQVWHDTCALLPPDAPPLWAVGNQVLDEQDRHFLQQALEPQALVGCIGYSQPHRRFVQTTGHEQGCSAPPAPPLPGSLAVWHDLDRRLHLLGSPDPAQRQHRLHQAHHLRASKWYNAYYGQQLHTNLSDPLEHNQVGLHDK